MKACKKQKHKTAEIARKFLLLANNGIEGVGDVYFCAECEAFHITSGNKKDYVIKLLNSIRSLKGVNKQLKSTNAGLEAQIENANKKYNELNQQYRSLKATPTYMPQEEMVEFHLRVVKRYKGKVLRLKIDNRKLIEKNAELRNRILSLNPNFEVCKYELNAYVDEDDEAEHGGLSIEDTKIAMKVVSQEKTIE